MISFKPDDKIIFYRSAFLGDFMVCLPFISFLIEKFDLKKENISIVIINNKNFNPVKAIFGANDVLSINSQTLNSSDFIEYFKKILNFRRSFLKPNYVIYLPTLGDSLKGLILKRISIFFIHGLIKTFGFQTGNKNKSNSQYLYLFDFFNFKYERKDLLHLFNLSEISNHFLLKRDARTERTKIIIYPNSKLQMKIWPLQNYITLINSILTIYTAKIYLIGSKEDFFYNEQILNGIKPSVDVVNVAGEFSILESITFYKEASLFIGNDGFPMHIAAIVNIPIVGIFTFKNPIGWWDPIIADKMITLRKHVACKECYLDSCSKPICILNIQIQDVLQCVKTILSLNKKNVFKEFKVSN